MLTQHPFHAGFALLLVLSVLILLSLLSGSFSLQVQHAIQHSAWLTQQTHQQAAAQAGIFYALGRITHPNTAHRWSADGQPHTFSWHNIPIQLRIRNEQAKIDLNHAPYKLLHGLLQQVLPEQSANSLTNAILDWRDTDQYTRQGDQESIRYHPQLPFNRPFLQVAELAQVAGFNANSVAQLAPFLTVYSHRTRINPRSAASAVIAALPGISPSRASLFIQHRERALATGRPIDFSLLSSAMTWIDTHTNQQVIAIQADIALTKDSTYQAEAIIRLLGTKSKYQVIHWDI